MHDVEAARRGAPEGPRDVAPIVEAAAAVRRGGAPLSVANLLALQRSAGNAAVGRVVAAGRGRSIQRTLTVKGVDVAEEQVGSAVLNPESNLELPEDPASIVNVLEVMAASKRSYVYAYGSWPEAVAAVIALLPRLSDVKGLASPSPSKRVRAAIDAALAAIEPAAQLGPEQEKPPKKDELPVPAAASSSAKEKEKEKEKEEKEKEKEPSESESAIGQHARRGHLDVSDQDLIAQARDGHSNSKWTSEEAMVRACKAAVAQKGEKGAALLSAEKGVEVEVADGDCYGFVVSTKNVLFKVFPRTARIVFRAEGDTRTAYGVTEELEQPLFEFAYYRSENLGRAKK